MIRYVCLILFGGVAFLGQAQEKWQSFVSYEGKFSVDVPSEMSEQVQQIPTEIGELEYHRFFYQQEGENANDLIYMVNYIDYPEGALHSDSTDLVNAIFEATKEEAVFNVVGKLKYANPIQLKDFPGQIWRIDYNEGHATLKAKAFVVNNRFYLVQVATSKAKRLDAALNDFLDSFSLL